jgi:hypothetical protein
LEGIIDPTGLKDRGDVDGLHIKGVGFIRLIE